MHKKFIFKAIDNTILNCDIYNDSIIQKNLLNYLCIIKSNFKSLNNVMYSLEFDDLQEIKHRLIKKNSYIYLSIKGFEEIILHISNGIYKSQLFKINDDIFVFEREI